MTRLIDIVLGAAIFFTSMMIGTQYLERSRVNGFGNLLPAISMVACGQGLSMPGAPTPAFHEFARRERPSLACAEVTAGTPAPPNAFSQSHTVLIRAAGHTAAMFGDLSWRALDRMMGAALGVTMTLAFALFRLIAGPLLAVAGVVALLTSDYLAVIADVRDFVKAPAFYAVWLVLGWMMATWREPSSRTLYVLSAAAGAVIGLGAGLRMDVIIAIPACVLVIALAVRGWQRPALIIRGRALAAFGAALVVALLPTLASVMPSGSNSAHVGVLGQMTPFTAALGLQPPLYDVGSLYADGFARTVVAVHATRVGGDAEVGAIPSREYDRQGFRLLRDLASRFPADQFVRVIAAIRQVVRYPFSEPARRWAEANAALADAVKTPGRLISRVFAVIDGGAIAIVALVLFSALARDVRIGVAVMLLGILFGGYSAWQFGRRHTFHLDLIAIGAALAAFQLLATLAWAMARRRRPALVAALSRTALVRAALVMAAAVATFVVVLTVARWQQDRQVAAMLEASLQLPWQPAAVQQEPVAMDFLSWHVSYAADPTRWANAVLLRVADSDWPASRDRVRADYLRADIGGASCADGVVAVALKYTGPVPTLDWEHTRVFDVPVASGAGPTILLLPVFTWEGQSRFDGLVVAADRAGCVSSVRRANPASVPFPILAASLPPDWRARPHHQVLGE